MQQLLSIRAQAQPETVLSFQRAAFERLIDAEILDSSNRRLAAVYLYGYATEMLIKAAYFRAVHRSAGLIVSSAISLIHRNTARNEWQALGLSARPGHHDLSGWAQLLIAKRVSIGDPLSLDLRSEVINQSNRLYDRWRETLRYSFNNPYLHELRVVREAAQWFRENSHDL